MSGSTTTLGGLARQLVQQGILTEAAAAQAWQSAQKEQTPFIIEAVDAFRFNTGSTIETVVVEADKLAKLIEKIIEGKSNASMQGLDDDLEDIDISGGEEAPAGDDGSTGNAEDDAPIVKYINKILLDAIKMGASDLHFEPYEKSYRIRFRVDGVLREITRPPVQLATKLAARLKVMSQMDISERRLPQDGRIKLKLSKTRAIDFRVNSLPTLFGEKLCLRILDPSSASLGIDMLGYEPDQKALFMGALEKPQGMLLITGPTGSGKTVSLYTGLNILNTGKQHFHGRRPGGNQPGRHQPGQRQRQGGPDLRLAH
jgi:type IV pilus assembly protein PilB